MLACRTLDGQLELHRRKGVQYLGRKVREMGCDMLLCSK
jgi:hypothetical protein